MKKDRLSTILLLIIAVILIAVILRYTAQIFIPFTISCLLLFVVTPIINILRKRLKMPRILSIIIVIILFVVISIIIGYVLFASVRSLVSQYTFYFERLNLFVNTLIERYDLPQLSELDLFNVLGLEQTIRSFVIVFSGEFISFFSGVVLVALFLFFLLLEHGMFIKKIVYAFNDDTARILHDAVQGIYQKVTRYLSIKVVVSFVTATVVGVGFSIIGVDFPIVWAVLTFLFNFIPSIGSIIITALTALFALAQFAPNWGPIIATILLMAVTQISFGNILEPRLLGHSLNLSTVFIVLSLLIWGVIWGVAGLFLAVPMTVILVSILENIPITKPISELLKSKKLT